MTSTDAQPLTTASFWRDAWREQDGVQWDDGTTAFVPEWHDLLCDELSARRGGTCLEVGAFPGRYMHYLRRVYDMRVEGIDLMESPRSDANGERLQIRQADFLKLEEDRRFDVVCSFGFVEHFQNFEDVLRRHLTLVKPGGLLLVTVPNYSEGWRFRGRRARDAALFQHHCREAMQLEDLRAAVAALPARSGFVRPLRFSDKMFLQASPAKRALGHLARHLVRTVPIVDRGLATEVLTVVVR